MGKQKEPNEALMDMVLVDSQPFPTVGSASLKASTVSNGWGQVTSKPNTL